MEKKVLLGWITVTLLFLGGLMSSPKLNSMAVSSIDPVSGDSISTILVFSGLGLLLVGLFSAAIYFLIRKEEYF